MVPDRTAHLHALREFGLRVWRRFSEADVTGLAAEMSYYFVLSIFPFLIVLAAVVGWLPLTDVWGGVLKWITLYFPRGSQRMVFQIVVGLTEGRTGFLSVGLAGTLWAATSGLLSLMDALNQVYGVEETRGYLHRLGLAVLMILLLAVMVLCTFALLTVWGWINRWVAMWPVGAGSAALLWRWARWCASICIIGLSISVLDRTLPAIRRPWRRTLPGVAFIVVGWILSTASFNLYAEHLATFNRTYGVLGVFVLLMVWIYLLSMVILLGAVINSEVSKMRAPRHRGMPAGFVANVSGA